MFKLASKLAVCLLFLIALIELALALWTILDDRYKSLAFTLADVGYIDLWSLRYLSLCLFTSAIITLFMCFVFVWGFYSNEMFFFVSSTMVLLVLIGEFTLAILTFNNKFHMRLTLQEQLPKLVITYRQGNDERARRALDVLQMAHRCCGSDGRLSYQNNVPHSCNMFSVGCLTRTISYLDTSMDGLASGLFLFSLIKLLIIILFYSIICANRRPILKSSDDDHQSINNSTEWRHSASFDSTSTDTLAKKILITPDDSTPIEKRRVILNEYDLQSSSKRVQCSAPLPVSLEKNSSNNLNDQHFVRKLSAISEKTEKTVTDNSEQDILQVKSTALKRPTSINIVPLMPPPLPKKLPIMKHRNRLGRDDDNDSGVEHSSSEKSFDDQQTSKRSSSIAKSSNTLSFSNMFVTSISQTDIKNCSNNEQLIKSASLSEHLLSPESTPPKPILKKSFSSEHGQKKFIPLLKDKHFIQTINHEQPRRNQIIVPKPAPRPSLKQTPINRKPATLV